MRKRGERVRQAGGACVKGADVCAVYLERTLNKNGMQDDGIYLVQREIAVLDVPVPDMNGTVGSESDAIDTELDLANANFFGPCTRGGHNLLHGYDRAQDIRASGERDEARLRRDKG